MRFETYTHTHTHSVKPVIAVVHGACVGGGVDCSVLVRFALLQQRHSFKSRLVKRVTLVNVILISAVLNIHGNGLGCDLLNFD